MILAINGLYSEEERDMRYRKMAIEMTDTEIQTLIQLIYENVEVTHYKRYKEENFIRVYFKYPSTPENQEMEVDFLPDDIYINDTLPFNEHGNQMFLYRQYMVAKGYSDYWKGNMFISELSTNYDLENIIRLIEENQTQRILEIVSNCSSIDNALETINER